MALYKYVTKDRVDVVHNCRIRFSPVDDLNDPFECLTDTLILDDPQYLAAEQERVTNAFDRDLSFALALAGKTRFFSRAKIRTLVEKIRAEEKDSFKNHAFKTLHEVRKPFRLLCLTRVSPAEENALLLWGHYTGGHKGMVFEFDEAHPWVTAHNLKRGERHDAGDAIYKPKRPGWNCAPDGSITPSDDYMFRKSPVWSYEREFRLVRFAGGPGVNIVDTAGGRIDALVDFPPKCLLSVTFGKNTSPDTKDAVRAAKRAHLPHLILRQATIDRDEYKVNLAPDRSAAT